MKLFFVLCAVVVVASASELDDKWNQFMIEHEKIYTPEDEVLRKQIFAKNLDLINKHNAEASNGIHKFTLGVNHFADLTNDEFKQLNRLRLGSVRPFGLNTTFIPNYQDVPASIDWRTKGAVTEVKDQGQCGSCWSFSATGSLEGQYFLKSKKLVSLSEQELCDCTKPEGNEGCLGGLMDYAFAGLKRIGGIETEKDYPYEAQGDKCRYDAKKKTGVTVSGFKDIPTGDEKALTEAAATIGPISVAIDASHESFQFYSEGVYDEKHCSSSVLDHGVLVVGYGTENGKDYYIVKNSWSEKWGLQGFIKMSRNKDNQCGIATQASYPLL